ncbi:hypothetical protein J3Q64DRAFT_1713485 [Phycomyces blakesleeanus]|uniref:Nitrogen regulatory protein areA GATA-like domain-containing protein n=2 Tax=Phycomyces blakesleeanus TaxID=4837 RepID=A0A167Q793_PHYB8|nr:hypothetical protein PHYBLDRAFT_139239 [Phycomyces blakesleeanus NRRL 1555(-)]OAD79204.1 hypothetical protein PHYBLDRAFT_139239 [Phycomyces blakesleeanus NRRL 1555(-)]|eukprot:XP_018297244.1 hypothetical protein PHYBLDRAFT_139239 [Phycomyces blakesleeanus NRRL 1555(-)]
MTNPMIEGHLLMMGTHAPNALWGGHLELSLLWSVFSKCKKNVQGLRIENISWRLWYRQAVLRRPKAPHQPIPLPDSLPLLTRTRSLPTFPSQPTPNNISHDWIGKQAQAQATPSSSSSSSSSLSSLPPPLSLSLSLSLSSAPVPPVPELASPQTKTKTKTQAQAQIQTQKEDTEEFGQGAPSPIRSKFYIDQSDDVESLDSYMTSSDEDDDLYYYYSNSNINNDLNNNKKKEDEDEDKNDKNEDYYYWQMSEDGYGGCAYSSESSLCVSDLQQTDYTFEKQTVKATESISLLSAMLQDDEQNYNNNNNNNNNNSNNHNQNQNHNLLHLYNQQQQHDHSKSTVMDTAMGNTMGLRRCQARYQHLSEWFMANPTSTSTSTTL